MIKYSIHIKIDEVHQDLEVWANDSFHAQNIAKKILAKKLEGKNANEYGFGYGVKIPLERKN